MSNRRLTTWGIIMAEGEGVMVFIPLTQKSLLNSSTWKILPPRPLQPAKYMGKKGSEHSRSSLQQRTQGCLLASVPGCTNQRGLLAKHRLCCAYYSTGDLSWIAFVLQGSRPKAKHCNRASVKCTLWNYVEIFHNKINCRIE